MLVGRAPQAPAAGGCRPGVPEYLGGRAVKKMGFLGSPRRFLILPGDRTEERPVFSYLQAGFFKPKISEILLKMGIFSL